MSSRRSGCGNSTGRTWVRDKVALEQGVGVLKQGGVAVMDFHVDPGEERLSAATAGGRKTG